MIFKKENKEITLTTTRGEVKLRIRRGKRKSITFSYNVDEQLFIVKAPYLTSLKVVKDIFYEKEKSILALIDKTVSKTTFGDSLYMYGKSYPISELNSLLKTKKAINSLDDFYKVSKKSFQLYLNSRVAHYQEVMNISRVYKVSVRTMKTRWGVNSLKTNRLTFASMLIHYSQETIDSVVIHELVHDEIRGHGKDFYEKLTRYCPYHKQASLKLRKNIYE